MKKVILILSLFLAVIGMSAFINNDQPLYKNLKILPKNISKHDLDSTMKSFCLSLGVRCNFCHVRVEQEDKFYFENDDIANKRIARQMLTMVKKINKKYFKPEEGEEEQNPPITPITCYTCHRGHELPETKPPLPPIKQPPPLPKKD